MSQTLVGAAWVFVAGLVLGLIFVAMAYWPTTKKDVGFNATARDFFDSLILVLLGWFLTGASAVGLLVCGIIHLVM